MIFTYRYCRWSFCFMFYIYNLQDAGGRQLQGEIV
jgi:hypothetical protein